MTLWPWPGAPGPTALARAGSGSKVLWNYELVDAASRRWQHYENCLAQVIICEDEVDFPQSTCFGGRNTQYAGCLINECGCSGPPLFFVSKNSSDSYLLSRLPKCKDRANSFGRFE